VKAVIVCNGAINNYKEIKKYIGQEDYIISVDGGARHLRKMEIAPSILLGDFDSAKSEDLQYFIDKGVEVYKFPIEKDMTDSELAIEKALGIGADELVFIGALGSRVDHSIAIIDEHNEIYMYNTSFTIPQKKGYKLSLIPITDKVTGVSTTGLKYVLKDATMALGTSWGVSNEFLENIARVTIGEGIMLVCVSKD
jgi:thiamine pyrophosphokinase